MITFSPEAQHLFDRYLQTVRWSVRGIAGSDEIEHNVREHVTAALEDQQEPVSSRTLRDVLSRLGDPWEWIPTEELPLWKRLLMRFSIGPEDWRLAYLCFALTLLGFVLMPVGIGMVFLIGAFLLARATLDLASDRDNTLGPRRWLIYPPLVFFYVIFLAGFLMGPAGGVIGWGVGEHGFELLFEVPANHVGFYVSAVSITIGTWLFVLSVIVALAVRPLRWMFKPFANGLQRVHALWLTAAGVVFGGAGAALLLLR